jgi:hypothetical protein
MHDGWVAWVWSTCACADVCAIVWQRAAGHLREPWRELHYCQLNENGCPEANVDHHSDGDHDHTRAMQWRSRTSGVECHLDLLRGHLIILMITRGVEARA